MGKRDAGEAISLFPFMSILACLIGTLTMVISLLALQQASDSEEAQAKAEAQLQADPEALARAKRLQTLKEEWNAQRARFPTLQKQVADLAADASSLAAFRDDVLAQIAQFESERTQESDELAKAAKLADQVAALKKQFTDLQQEFEAAETNRKKLEQELAQRKKPPAEAQVVIQPSGTGSNLQATFVECRDTGLVLLDNSGTPHIRTADLASDPQFQALLAKVAATPNSTLIFLLRANGLGTFTTAHSLAVQAGARSGKLPVIGQGKIDLSLFRSKK